MSLLEQDSIRRWQLDNNFADLELKLNAANNKKYNMKTIKNSVAYTKNAARQLPSLYYFIFWKDYPKEKGKQ